MRCAHIIPTIEPESGGPAESTIEVINAIGRVNDGISQWLLSTSFGLDRDSERRLRRRVGSQCTLGIFGVPLEWKRSKPFLTRLAGKAGRHVQRVAPSLYKWLAYNIGRFDVVVVRSTFNLTSIAASELATLKNVPYVLSPHGMLGAGAIGSSEGLLKRGVGASLVNRQVRNANAIQVASEVAWPVGVESTDVAVQVIPHAYDAHALKEKRESDGSGEDDVILYLGRLAPIKNIEMLIEAVASLVVQGRNSTKLLIAGKGDANYKQSLQEKCVASGVTEHVSFCGFVEGVRKTRVIRRARVAVLPSHYDSFGMAAVEVMAMGKPVIVSRSVGVATWIREYGAGLVYQGTHLGLSRAIEEVLDATLSERQRMAKAGRRLVGEYLDPIRVGREWSALLERVAS